MEEPQSKKIRLTPTCSICLDDLSIMNCCTIKSCSHTFHSACLWQWLCTMKCCPLCRNSHVTCEHGDTVLEHDDSVVRGVFARLLDEYNTMKTQKDAFEERVMVLEQDNRTSFVEMVFVYL